MRGVDCEEKGRKEGTVGEMDERCGLWEKGRKEGTVGEMDEGWRLGKGTKGGDCGRYG